VKRQQGWVELLQQKANLSDLIDATERRRADFGQPAFPTFCLYVDQGEELYARAAEPDRRRFSKLLSEALSDPPACDDEHAIGLPRLSRAMRRCSTRGG
jgi:hypothetical protein